MVHSHATSQRTWRRADHDLLEQLVAVRKLAAQVPITLDEAVDAVCLRRMDPAEGPGLRPVAEVGIGFDTKGDADSGPLPTRRLYRDEDMVAQTTWARTLREETRSVVLRALERACELGPMRTIPTVGSSLEMEQLCANFPNFSEVTDFVWGRAVLCGMSRSAVMRLPPILLNGPPGTGKTTFCEQLAMWLGVPIHHVDIPSMDTSFKITGLDSGYATGKPGTIWDALQGPSMAPVIVLDELDKPNRTTSDEGLGFLLGLLEPVTAARYKDACMGLPIDASRVMWLATSNDASLIDAPLLSRMRVFNITAPDASQMQAVTASVWRSMRRTEEWAEVFPEELPGAVLAKLQGYTPRELRQVIEDACTLAATAHRPWLQADDVAPQLRRVTRRTMGFLT
jgi:ATP-dependent Lon protease